MLDRCAARPSITSSLLLLEISLLHSSKSLGELTETLRKSKEGERKRKERESDMDMSEKERERERMSECVNE